MAVNTKKWLMEQFGFSEAEADAALPTFATREDRIEAFESSRTQLETDRAAIATSQAALEQANHRLNEQIAEWARVQTAGEPATIAMRTDLENARAEVAKLTTRLTMVAQQAGIDPATVVPPAQPAPPAGPAAPDLTGFARVDNVSAQLGNMASYLLDLQPELNMIAHEHQQLTGEFLDTRPIIAEIKARAANKTNAKPLDPRAIWNEQHQIDAKRAARDQATRTADLAAAESRGYERARTEQSLPGAVIPGSHAPVFTHPSASTSKLQRPTAPNRVAAAAAALATHRYRTKVPA